MVPIVAQIIVILIIIIVSVSMSKRKESDNKHYYLGNINLSLLWVKIIAYIKRKSKLNISKKALYIIGGLFILLVITNPSTEDFRSKLHVSPNYYRYMAGRDANYFILSTYTDDMQQQKYIGILGDFYKL